MQVGSEEIQNHEMKLESHVASKDLYNSSRINLSPSNRWTSQEMQNSGLFKLCVW